MKKLNKSLICLLLIAAMIVTFAGCGQEPAPTEPEVVPVSMIDIGTGLSLKVGETGTLTATVNMKATNKDVTWASSDEAIVTVTANGNEATVTAVAAGEATITATAADGSGVTASCTVTVSQVSEAILSVGQAGELPAEPAEGITGDITLNSDGTCAINAFYANLNAQLAFETTYEIVDGVLTFAADPVDATVMGISGQIGTAAEVAGDTIVITCTEVNQGVTAAQFIMTADQAAQLGITVGSKVDVESISVPESKTLASGAVFDMAQMVTFNPENPTVSDITITVSDTASQVVYVDTTSIYPLMPGSVTITVTSVDNPEATASMVLTVEAVERPAFLATKYFETERTFGWALNSYVFKTDGTVDILDKTGVLQVLGYYTLSEDGTQLTMYALNEIAANPEFVGYTYNLTKQEGSELLQYDIGEPLGAPGMYFALEQAN
ncbi:MAG: Ig domain-containing protein [Oscillospiraceae bacterium]|nr:Ig domain-containing protein [Oscillospiraceae bacterium]MBQ3543347.1 Ig domain-containing protein [Oscillospiraceae bacterium]